MKMKNGWMFDEDEETGGKLFYWFRAATLQYVMKNWFLFLLAGLLPLLAATPSAGPPTVIYLVRHAEKSATPNDPALAPEGEARAQVLRQKLAGKHPAALFTTDTRRTRATLAPLAQATGLTPQVYSPTEPDAFAIRLYQEYAGRTVVVVGHSNTLLPLLAALGVKAPMTEIPETQYDNLFRVTLRPGEPAQLKVSHYGAR